MSKLSWEQKVILFKEEATYGVDSTPTGAANAILARNVTFDPNPTDSDERPVVKPGLGNIRKPQIRRRVGITFDVELAGAGGAGTIPAWGPVARAAGFAQTQNVGVDVQYDLVSAAYESASSWFFVDGIRHQLTGVRGSPSVVVGPNTVPLLRCTFTGLHVDPDEQSNPTADYSAFEHPLAVGNVNTPTFTVDGFSPVLREWTTDVGQVVNFGDYVNRRSVDILDRDPSGDLLIETPALSDKNFFAVSKAETLVPIQFVHGTAAGGIVQVDTPKVQLMNPRYESADSEALMRIDLNVCEDAGDDELKITVK